MRQYPKYKDSGVSWIGEIPEHWEVIRFRFLSKIGTGNSNTQDSDPDGLYPFYVRSPKVERSSNYNYEGEAILMAGDGAGAGRIFHHVNGKYAVHQRVYIFNSFNREYVDSNFLFYFIDNCFPKRMDLGSKQSTVPSVRLPMIQNFEVAIPSKDEQRAIVSFLDKKTAQIDSLIAATEKKIEKLNELKQAHIAQMVTHGVTPNVPMKDSGIAWIGQIPKHWEVSKIRSHFKERRTKVSDKDYPALSVAREGIVPQLETAVKTDNGDNRKLVLKNDFVVNSRSDRKGSCGVSNYNGSVSLISIVLEPHDINPQYVHHLFRSNNYIEEFYRNGRGIVADLWTTRYSEMKNIFIPIPPASEQAAIVSAINSMTDKIDTLTEKLTSQIDYLKELKQRIISDAVTGKFKC